MAFTSNTINYNPQSCDSGKLPQNTSERVEKPLGQQEGQIEF